MSLQIAAISSSAAHWPKRCTAITALVFLVMDFLSDSGSRLNVPASTSANTGVAPVYDTASPVAKKVKPGITTSSPGPMPAAKSGKCSASVPELQPTASAAPTNCAISRSSASPSGPSTKRPEENTRATAASISPLSSRYSPAGSTIGMFMS